MPRPGIRRAQVPRWQSKMCRGAGREIGHTWMTAPMLRISLGSLMAICCASDSTRCVAFSESVARVCANGVRRAPLSSEALIYISEDSPSYVRARK